MISFEFKIREDNVKSLSRKLINVTYGNYYVGFLNKNLVNLIQAGEHVDK